MARQRDDNNAQDAAFETEHWLAWGFSGLALLLGFIGLMRAFGIIGPANTTAAGQVTSISPGGLPDTLWDGGLWLLSAITSTLLALAFHRNDHHRMRDLEQVPDREEGLWKTEHLVAYVMAAASVAFALIGLLTAFNKVGGHHWQPDGIPWLLTSFGTALLTNVFHSVRHHQLDEEQHYDRRRMATDDFVQVRRPDRTAAGYQPESPMPAEQMRAEAEDRPLRRR